MVVKEKYSTLWAFITNQEGIIQEIFEKIERLKPSNEDKLVHLAYQLHNLYSSFEDLFKEISITFENHIDRTSGFHKNLLLRMKMPIPDIRPEVLSGKSHLFLGELMGFRHVFRHAYDYNLSADKLNALRKKLLMHYPVIVQDVRKFKDFLEDNFKENTE